MKAPRDWRHQFALMSAGQIFSIIGSSAAQFAIIWWLTVETGSAITLSIAALVGYLPQALLGPFIGVWVDRYDRKRIMMLSDSFIALVSGGLALAFVLGAAGLPVIYLALFLRALGSAFHGVAYQTVIPAFVPQDSLTKAGGWGAMVRSGAGILGPVIGAALMGVASIPVIMLVDIAGAALAVGSLFFIHVPRLPPSEHTVTVMEDIRIAFKAMTGNRRIMTMVPILLIVVFIANPTFSLLSLMVSQHFGGGVWHNSAIQLCASVGILLGSAIMGVWGGGRRQFALIAVSILVTGGCAMLGGLLPGSMFIPFMVAMFIIGLVNSGVNVPYDAFIQRAVEPHLLGKVMGLVATVNAMVAPLGLALAGPMAQRLGVARWYAVSGVILVAVGVFMLIKARTFDRPELSLPQTEA